MRSYSKTRILVVGGWCVFAAIVLFSTVLIFHDAYSQARTATKISRVILDGDPVDLPLVWRGSPGVGHSKQIEFTLNSDNFAPSEIYVHVPFFEQVLQVSLNDTKVFDSAQVRPWVGPVSALTAMVLLPPDLLQSGENTVEITVLTGARPPGALSRILVGRKDQVESIYLLRKLLNEALPSGILGIQIFLAFSGLIVFSLRPHDEIFGWLGMMTAGISAVSLMTFSNIFPALETDIRFAIGFVPFGAFGLLGFAQMLAGKPSSTDLVKVTLTLSATLFLSVLFGVRNELLGIIIVIPSVLFCFLGALYYLIRTIRRDPKAEVILFSVGLVALVAGSVHDFMLRTGKISDGLWVAQPSRIIILIAIAIFIVRHQSRIAVSLDNSSTILAGKLKEKEDELHQYYVAQQEAENARLVEEERARITADLHDGVAGHLATIAALSEHEQDQRSHIKQSAKNALLDLRMIIDALGFSEGNIIFYLGLFRDRNVDPLENLGVDIEWSMKDLPDMGIIPREDALNIIRILQEAVSNALRHGHLEKLTITGKTIDKAWFQISVHSIAKALSDEEAVTDSSGLGLISMKNRAASLGGTVELQLLETGANVVLTVPSVKQNDDGLCCKHF